MRRPDASPLEQRQDNAAEREHKRTLQSDADPHDDARSNCRPTGFKQVLLHVNPVLLIGLPCLRGVRRQLLLTLGRFRLPPKSRRRELLVLLEMRALEVADFAEEGYGFGFVRHGTSVA